MSNRTKRKGKGLDFSQALMKHRTNRYNPNDPQYLDVHQHNTWSSSFMLTPHSQRPRSVQPAYQSLNTMMFHIGLVVMSQGASKRLERRRQNRQPLDACTEVQTKS